MGPFPIHFVLLLWSVVVVKNLKDSEQVLSMILVQPMTSHYYNNNNKQRNQFEPDFASIDYFIMNSSLVNRRAESKKLDGYFLKKYFCKLILKYIFKSVLTFIVLRIFKDFSFKINDEKCH